MNKKFKETIIPLTVIVTNLTTGKAEYFSSRLTPESYIYEVVRASISIPVLFKYTKIVTDKYPDGFIAIDGGVTHNFAVDFSSSSKKTYGLRVLSPNNTVAPYKDDFVFNPFDKDSWFKLFFGIFNYLFLIINIMMWNLEQKHIDDAIYCNIINLKTGKNSVSFDHTINDINDMIIEGYHATDVFLKKENNK